MENSDFNLTKSFVNRLRNNKTFMAHSLSVYQKYKGFDDEDLARELGTIPEMILRLSLCRKPQKNSHTFTEQITCLSDFTLIDETKLTEIITVSVLAEEETQKQPEYFQMAHRVMEEQSAKRLIRMTKRVRNNADFMAETLRLYKQQNNLNDEQLAQNLGTSQAMLLHLAICKRPDSTAHTFNAQVSQLADYIGIDAHRLSGMIRQVDSLKIETKRKSRLTRDSAAFIQSAVYRLKTVSLHSSRLLACACLIVAIYWGVSWWQEIRNRSEERLLIAFQTSRLDESVNTANKNPDGERSTEFAAKRLTNRNEMVPHNLSRTPTRQAKQIERETNMLARITVDLDEYKIMRNQDKSSEPRKIIRLPQSRTYVSFNLPEGLVKGTYSIFIIDAFNKPLISSRARSVDGKTLKVVLDTTNLEAKTYRLCITRTGEAPNYYLVVVEKM